MTTAVANLDTSQYVKVNSAPGSFTLQAHRDTVRIAFSDVKPALGNTAHHELGGALKESILQIPYTETGIWVLAMTDRSKLTVTTHPFVQSGITDRQGRSTKISQKGELLTGSCVDDVDVNFQYTIRSVETVSTVTGTGVVSHPGVNGSYAELSPGAGVGRAELISRAPVRYRAGHEVYCEASWIFRSPESTSWQEFCGFVNDNDRFMIGYQNDVFGILFREGGNDTFTAQSSFNIDTLDGTGPSGYTINPQAINVYRLSYVWHGGLPLTVEVQVGQKWIPVHVLDFSNSITETHLENPHLPVGGFIERTAGSGSSDAARTGSWRGGAIAAAVDEPSDDWLAWTVLDRSLSNARNNVFTLRNPLTWQGKQNHIVYELGVVTFDNSANKTVAVYGVKGATITGATAGPTFIDEDNYALQYIEGGTLSGGVQGPATVLKSGADRRTDVRDTGILIYPGEDFAFEVDPGGPINGTFSISARLIHGG